MSAGDHRTTSTDGKRDRAILVGVVGQGMTVEEVDEELDELEDLAQAALVDVCGRVVQRRGRPDPTFFVGRGKLDELDALYEETNATVAVFNDELSPSQARNVEKRTGIRAITRSEVILDIFASRARTHQARLQVELAMAEYQLPRLKRLWTHLGRIRGGVNIKGMGEKQIEVDRRLIRTRIAALRAELAKIDEREKRSVAARAGTFQVSLVGYTNVGKSTLMNALTGADATVADMLFATLDTKTRAMALDGNRRALLSDTVGFVRKLPHHLVASFHATLEEAINADLVLHVADASHPTAGRNVAAVEEVLAELGIDAPVVMVLNKIDCGIDNPDLHILERRYPSSVRVSARTGAGLDLLRAEVVRAMRAGEEHLEIAMSRADGRLAAFLHRFAAIEKSDERDDDYVDIRCRIPKNKIGELKRIGGDARIRIV